MYPKSFAGVVECYGAAFPFFQNALAGNLFFNAVFFGGLTLSVWRLPRLWESYAN